MVLPARPLRDIHRQATELLTQEMGLGDVARFLGQFTTGYGNYTEKRKELFADTGLEEILSEIRKDASL